MNNYIDYNWVRGNGPSYPTSLFRSDEGYIKGNLFQNLYNQYDGYQPKELTPRSEQEKCLYELSAVAFAAHELNLYLDLHPEDQSMVTLFNDYRKKLEELTKTYESMYGPLSVNSNEMENKTFSWVNTPWPWEGNNV